MKELKCDLCGKTINDKKDSYFELQARRKDTQEEAKRILHEECKDDYGKYYDRSNRCIDICKDCFNKNEVTTKHFKDIL